MAPLLHDFYLYDWHEAAPPFHGYRHPFCAVREAEARFQLNPVERDIIKKHMFPLTPFPPVNLESRIVCYADKASAVEDYSGLIKQFFKTKFSTANAMLSIKLQTQFHRPVFFHNRCRA